MPEIRLSVAIFSHPSRAKRLEETLKLLGNDVDVKVIIDTQTEGIWKTAMRAWRAYDSDATHHLVLQDDIIPAKNFLAAVPEVITGLSPLFAVSFCDNIPMMRYAEKRGDVRWIKSSQVRHAQALLQPVEQIEHFIEWAEWNIRPSYYHDDGRLEIYLHKHGKFIWHIFPSLVAHVDIGSVYRYVTTGELKPEYKRPYTEHAFIGQDIDPRTLDWGNGRSVGKPTTKLLRRADRWAVGDFEYQQEDWEALKSINSRIWNEKSLSMTYEETMTIARKERGLI